MQMDMMMQIDRLDHLVLTVQDIERTCDFYRQVLGMQVVTFGGGRRALRFGDQKINLHQAGREFEPKALRPTAGSGDLCFLTVTPLDDVIAHVQSSGVTIEAGPVARSGALGPIRSIYLRDPDGNLIEVANQEGVPMLNFEPIGTVRSPISEGVDENWGAVVAEIHLAEHLAPGLQGLEQFSHVLVVFWMHQSSFDAASDLVRRPRGRADMPPVGIFAQRAKHRPNPIGITVAELVGVRGAVLKLRGLDAIDGTPVLDLKPYVPAFDRVTNATVPEWIERLMEGYF